MNDTSPDTPETAGTPEPATLEALPALNDAPNWFSTESLVRWMNLALGIVMTGIDTTTRVRALNDEIERMVAEGREPTPEEWEALRARSDIAHQRIQGA